MIKETKHTLTPGFSDSSIRQFMWLLLPFVLLFYMFHRSLYEMYTTWMTVDEYGHGFFIPLISLYFLWIRRYELEPVSSLKKAVPGLIGILFGCLMFYVGNLATLKIIEQYAFILTFSSLLTALFGVKSLKITWGPLVFLLFMVPFPPFILNNLSAKLQLISSKLGVSFIRACDIMVFLQGNVIDLGAYKLQVVDACSGLRYLFPLSSLSFLCAYLFKGPFWQKAIIFLSSLPLTVFMNSFRIGVIGVLVNYWGQEMAEGFLHDFEGWIIFVFCLLLLLIEMSLFAWMNGKKTAWADLVVIPDEWHKTEPKKYHFSFNGAWFAGLLLISLGAIAAQNVQQREEIIPERKYFLNFPDTVADWKGRRDYLAKKFLDRLKLEDYIILNFKKENSANVVNFYVAYYKSQRKGASIHSPKACLPGDGWQIEQFGQMALPNSINASTPLTVNRVIIGKGDSRQLVYYWFDQRGRNITNEYLLKWYIFYDGITKNRTDGSLIRFVTALEPGEDIAEADARIQALIAVLLPELKEYLPGDKI